MTPVKVTSWSAWLILASTAALCCNSVEKAADGGLMGAGVGGNAGAGGANIDTSCLGAFEGCISTCGAADVIVNPSPYCDAQGRPQCPTGSQAIATCAPQSCARVYNNCCDPITGANGPAPCRPDGIRDVCPTGALPAPDFQCIPAGLGVTDCLDLQGRSCTLAGQRCHGGYGDCSCPPADLPMTWQCTPFLPG
jgi:hypothetical protein